MVSLTIEYMKVLRLSFLINTKYQIPEQLKNYYFKRKLTGEYYKYKNSKKIILMQTPTHKNLGDQAIAYAQIEFIRRLKEHYEIIEIPYNQVYSKLREIKSILNKDDIIAIHGGGNMGDMYSNEEYIRRFIIKKFRKNKIISFPQTISFSNTSYGKSELKKSIKVYNSNQNLILVARETISYDKMHEVFNKTKVILTPDIVLALDIESNNERNGIVICLRSDIEKSIESDFKKELIDILKSNYLNVRITDTINNVDVECKIRESELNKKWDEFKTAEVVITDRLHGMIFCAITRTPCIVFANSNHKIEQSYTNWLSDLEHIKFVENKSINEILLMVEELSKMTKDLKIQSCINSFGPLIEEFTRGDK